MARKKYCVIKYHQKLLSGSWNSSDCNWDWDYDYNWFNDIKEAEAYFNKQDIDNDTPIIRLYDMVYDVYYDGVEFIEDQRLLKELS